MFSLFVIGIKTGGKTATRSDSPAPTANTVRAQAACPANLVDVAVARIPVPERAPAAARKEALAALAP
ncbi:hypothetical protein [Chitinimonas sp.]|uniref:hypothetical protein n=1 Tax=Chitinimonas sp. TaxID=1934313 RepID=UPI002F94E973